MQKTENHYSPEELTQLLREGQLSFRDLGYLGFDPYYPDSLDRTFDKFSDTVINGFTDFFQANSNELANAGLLQASIVGSVAVGKAVSYPFGCDKKKTEFGYDFSRVPLNPDIDINALAATDNVSIVANELAGRLQHFLDNGNLSEAQGRIKIAIFPYEKIMEAVHSGEIPVLVRYGVYSPSAVNLHGASISEQLRNLSQNTVNTGSGDLRGVFWQHVADRFQCDQALMNVKRGDEKHIFLPKSEIPTMFIPQLNFNTIWQKVVL